MGGGVQGEARSGSGSGKRLRLRPHEDGGISLDLGKVERDCARGPVLDKEDDVKVIEEKQSREVLIEDLEEKLFEEKAEESLLVKKQVSLVTKNEKGHVDKKTDIKGEMRQKQIQQFSKLKRKNRPKSQRLVLMLSNLSGKIQMIKGGRNLRRGT